jgi:hypothetical protein
MRVRYGSIGQRSLIVATASLIIAACGGAEREPEEGTSPPPASSELADPADPLEGEWQMRTTCEATLRAVQQADVEPAQFKRWVAEMPALYGGNWEPTVQRPCDGAPSSFERTARFQDGDFALYEGSPPELGVATTYAVVDDHTFTADIDGPRTFEFRIEGDRLFVDALDTDPWIVAGWEPAPLVRVS